MTCLHQYLNELPIRDSEIDRAVHDVQRNSEKMHRATHEDGYTRAWFDKSRSVFPQSEREFRRINYAHVILTAEPDSLPTDEKKLLDDYGSVGCHSSKSNDLSVHSKIDSSGDVRLLMGIS